MCCTKRSILGFVWGDVTSLLYVFITSSTEGMLTLGTCCTSFAKKLSERLQSIYHRPRRECPWPHAVLDTTPLNRLIVCLGMPVPHKWDWDIWNKLWLVVWTPLKNISQLGWLFPIYGKIKMFQTTNQNLKLCSVQSHHILKILLFWSSLVMRPTQADSELDPGRASFGGPASSADFVRWAFPQPQHPSQADRTNTIRWVFLGRRRFPIREVQLDPRAQRPAQAVCLMSEETIDLRF